MAITSSGGDNEAETSMNLLPREKDPDKSCKAGDRVAVAPSDSNNDRAMSSRTW